MKPGIQINRAFRSVRSRSKRKMAVRISQECKAIGRNVWMLRRRRKEARGCLAQLLDIDVENLRGIELGVDHRLIAMSVLLALAQHYELAPQALFKKIA